MRKAKLRLDDAGRVLIPKELRDEIGVRPGDEVIVLVRPAGLLVTTGERSLRHAQEVVRRIVPPGVSLVDDFLEWRRQEAERESE